MGTLFRRFAFCTAAVAGFGVLAQQPPARTRTLEERVAQLEAGVASMDTRLSLERTRIGDDAGQTELALAGRVQALERMVERLATDVQRAQRAADDAARAAASAQRDADAAAREAARP
jgi:hypothetical protein